jgi:hypothetical protein
VDLLSALPRGVDPSFFDSHYECAKYTQILLFPHLMKRQNVSRSLARAGFISLHNYFSREKENRGLFRPAEAASTTNLFVRHTNSDKGNLVNLPTTWEARTPPFWRRICSISLLRGAACWHPRNALRNSTGLQQQPEPLRTTIDDRATSFLLLPVIDKAKCNPVLAAWTERGVFPHLCVCVCVCVWVRLDHGGGFTFR